MNKKQRKASREIPEQFIEQALQILNNVCKYNHKGCSECILKMNNGACLIETDFVEKFATWKKERNTK